MNEIPQGGAGGVPLHHDTDDGTPAQESPAHDETPTDETPTEEPPAEEQGDATTAEPGRARRLDPDERGEDAG
ncbi:hypothetical protein [Streptomyces sp. NRRL S-350]|uniref:hypothetical protein n=1 Tax=Streptomyces sp. NRRL S-350 TaxID=1463902 RepID=UPI0004C0438E|nr:hypothetical protein [Streptomyces sp. NRRL S-350]